MLPLKGDRKTHISQRNTNLGKTKVAVDGFGMSDVQNAIWFWRKPSYNLR